MSKVVYKASCWDCQDFCIGKNKRRLHDRKTEHFKAIMSNCHASAIADHVTSTGHNLKWDHYDILAKGRSDTHCKIKETLLIRELKPTLNDKVSSEKFIFISLQFLIRLDYQPLFRKGARAPLQNFSGRNVDQTGESGGNRA